MVTKNDWAMEITNTEFQDIVKNGHKLVVVEFFAEWCMPCLMMEPVMEDLAASECMKDVKFVKINIDDNPTLANKCKVTSIPCLVIFEEGEEVDRVVGSQTYDVIEEKIKKFL
ncbi:thioredoxin [Candidatus Pacearchaeota archaeon]|nr:thioredoxin [Candidatus Pacearchaeota archaeon]